MKFQTKKFIKKSFFLSLITPLVLVSSCTNSKISNLIEQKPKKSKDSTNSSLKPLADDEPKPVIPAPNNVIKTNKTPLKPEEPKENNSDNTKKENNLNNDKNDNSINDNTKKTNNNDSIKTQNQSDNTNTTQEPKKTDKDEKITKKEENKELNKQKNQSKNDLDNKEINFEDLNNLNLNIKIKIKQYQSFDALSFYHHIKENHNALISLLEFPEQIYSKYNISLENYANLNINNETGVIDNILIKFQLQNSNANNILNFKLQGFKIKNIKQINPKENFLIKQELETYKYMLQLYPSLIASFLIWNKNEQAQEILRLNQINNSNYNFEALANQNVGEYFNDQNIVLNPALPHLFLKINESQETKYDFKITGIKANDLLGTLEIQVNIFDRSDTVQEYPDLTKTFSFNNFASLSLNSDDFDLTIDNNTFETNISKYKNFIKKIKEIYDRNKHNKTNQDITSQISSFNLQALKQSIFNSLAYYFKNNLYSSKSVNLLVKDLFAWEQNIALYPFLSKYDQDNLTDLALKLVLNDNHDLEVIIEGNYKLFPFVADSFSDLNHLTFASEFIAKSFRYKLNLNKLILGNNAS